MIAIAAAGSAAAAVAKWAGPSAAVGVAVLAVDTNVITTVITSAQLTIVAGLAYMKHRSDVKAAKAKASADQGLEASRLHQAEAVARIDGQDRLIDQLQEQSMRDRAALHAAAQREQEQRDAFVMLEADVRAVRQQIVSLEIGIVRLTAQIEDLGQTPVWNQE